MRVLSVGVICSLLAGLAFGETTIAVNGKTIQASGNSIIVNRDTVTVDGTVLSGGMVEGSGKRIVEKRPVAGFAEIDVGIDANVEIKKGKEARCEITADDNLLPLILTECNGTKLRISSKDRYRSAKRVTIAIETPLLTRAELRGSGRIGIADVTEDTLTLVINGSGDITARGRATELTTTINGSGNVHAGDLKTATASLTVNGSGNIAVHATDLLTATVHGSGDITYFGAPDEVHTTVNGSGKITRR